MNRLRRWFPISLTEAFIAFMYLCATLQYVRYYSKATFLYLNMDRYLNGHERLPFQERVLPIFIIKPLVQSPWIAHHLMHENGNFTAARGPLYIISLLALLIAGIFVQKLYNRLSRDGALKFLVYPVFLHVIMWSYTIHNEADFSYPYDMLSVAFFAAGLFFIYTRKFLPLALIVAVGTLNRETTLFLVGIFFLDAASVPSTRAIARRFSLTTVPWARVAVLFAIWLAIKVTLMRHYAHNDNSENFVRFAYNFGELKPRLWPALLNICGYMLPVVFVLRQYLRPARFANYLFIFPVWFAVMFYTGVIVETRVYGELCSFTAIALVLEIEQYLRDRNESFPVVPYATREVTEPQHHEAAA